MAMMVKLQTTSFLQYKVPTKKRLKMVQVSLAWITTTHQGLMGNQSLLVEIVIHTPAPALANAVFNATGVNVRGVAYNS